MRTVACPSCGAPFRFRGASSVVGVCNFCRATLVRKGADLENLGQQAELLEDDSPLRIGADGKHRDRRFSVVGRIQYRYGAGVWNEWHVLFADGKSAWLSDASRNYTISYLAPPVKVPAFAELRPGLKLTLGGERYSVTNLEQAEVVAGEGELPFKFEAGWKADVADLRGEGTRFATIDYSEEVPHVYLGELLPFDVFGFSGLRDPTQVGFTKGRALAFKCTGCGAPIEKHLATTEVVACGSCGSVTDVTGTVAQAVQKNERNANAVQPSLPVGQRGTWRGHQYEIVGFMRRGVRVEGVLYEWGEYLLHNSEQGYAWISEYQGHFSFIKDAAELPKVEGGRSFSGRVPDVQYLGRRFRHFQRAEARVSALMGEFYWRVKVGDAAATDDYVAPPLILSSETTANEVTWSLGEYVEPEALWKAFALKGQPPTRVGVAPNQPSPHEGKVFRYWAVFFAAIVVAFLLNAVIGMFSSDKAPVEVAFTVPHGKSERLVSTVFDLGGRGGRPLTLETVTNLNDNWLALDMKLTEADSGRAWQVNRELGFRVLSGVKVGDSKDFAEINGVPAGRYTLTIDAKAGGQEWTGDVTGRVKLYREPAGWSNFWLMTGFLMLFPLIAWGRKSAFETKRWSESDYAPEDSGDSDD